MGQRNDRNNWELFSKRRFSNNSVWNFWFVKDDIYISTLSALIKTLNENGKDQYPEDFLSIDEVLNTKDNNINIVIDEIITDEMSDGETEHLNEVRV